MADGGWLVRNRTAIYQVSILAALLALVAGSAVNDLPTGLAIYDWLLLAMCTAPLLLQKRLNDRYALLGLFMGCYFLFFGAADLQTLLLGTDLVLSYRDGFLTSAELLILTGAGAALGGYLLMVATWKPDRSRRAPAEWPATSVFLIGLALWAVGLLASFYYQIYVVPSKLGYEAMKGLAAMGPLLTLFVMLGQMMLSVGALMLAYGYAKNGGPLWTILTIAIVAVQVVVGFIEDIKMTAIMAPVLVVMTRAMVTNRLSKGWIAYVVIFLILAFPLFQAYRVVTAERGLDRAQALERFDLVLEAAVSASDRVNTGSHRAESFLERSSSKGNLDLLLEHVGNDVPFLQGASLVPIAFAFVPRILMPDKEDVSVGALFGRVILKADSGVFISVSHLGELYWNYGWSGVFLGMATVGLLLGFVGTRFSLESGVTLTRVMVLLVTAQSLCMGFGGTMPVSYVLWLRGMAAIGLMHLCFARPGARAAASSDSDETASARLPMTLAEPVPRFPNLLR